MSCVVSTLVSTAIPGSSLGVIVSVYWPFQLACKLVDGFLQWLNTVLVLVCSLSSFSPGKVSGIVLLFCFGLVLKSRVPSGNYSLQLFPCFCPRLVAFADIIVVSGHCSMHKIMSTFVALDLGSNLVVFCGLEQVLTPSLIQISLLMVLMLTSNVPSVSALSAFLVMALLLEPWSGLLR